VEVEVEQARREHHVGKLGQQGVAAEAAATVAHAPVQKCRRRLARVLACACLAAAATSTTPRRDELAWNG